MTPKAAPNLTIAIIELAGGEALTTCISSVRAETESPATRISVMLRGASTPPGLSGDDRVTVFTNAGATIPARRLSAVEAADTDHIALLEDTTLPPSGWAGAIGAELSKPGIAACSGPVALSPALSPRYKALGYLEYGRFGKSVHPESALPGNCMAFDRNSLLAILDKTEEGLVEHEVSARLIRNGKTIGFMPEMVAMYAAPDEYGARLSTRFSHGRLYASAHYANSSVAARTVGALRGMLTPVVLMLRGATHMIRQSPARLWPAEGFWICLMSISAGLGEATGAILGKGNSAASWR